MRKPSVESRNDIINDAARKHGWTPEEKRHAAELGWERDDGAECVVPLANGREIRTAPFPEGCGYVRVVQPHHIASDPGLFELAYWESTEWKEDPEFVMGAFLGCCKAGG